MPLQPIAQFDFSKGENTVSSPYLLRPEQVQQAVNFLLDEHGSLRVRDGTLKQDGQNPDSRRPIIKLFDLVKTDGSVTALAILGPVTGSVNPQTLYRRDSTPWRKIADSSYSTPVIQNPDIIGFTNLAIIAHSNQDVLHSYDGTSFLALTGAPNAAHIANHLGYLWAWNTNIVTTASAGQSSLQSSDLNNANSWPGTNQTFISKDDGTSGQGLATYTIAESGIAPTATIIAFKDYSGYECTGVLGATGFAVQKIKSDMGCVAPRSVQFIAGFGIVRLTHRGFALYDGVNDTLISEEERPRIFGRDQYNGLDWSNIGHSQATQCANPPLYICACPTSGPALNLVFVYDLVRRSWTVMNFTNNIGTFQLVLDAGNLPSVLGGDWDQGYVRRYFAGDTTDDGTAIAWTLRTRAYAGQSASDRSYWRRMLLKAFGFTAGTQISTVFYPGPTAILQQKTVQVTVPSIAPISTFLGFGLDPFGTSGFGAVTPSLTDQELDFPIGLKANNMQMQISGTGPGRIRGIENHIRPQPLTRSTYVGV